MELLKEDRQSELLAQPESGMGQPGGGMEVIFVNGSPGTTVVGPQQIPP